jgi:hydrogenase 3 maturation protease
MHTDVNHAIVAIQPRVVNVDRNQLAPDCTLCTIAPMAASYMSSLIVLGVGNVLKGDDAVGPHVVERLSADYGPGKPEGSRFTAVDCGTTPENYTGLIRRERPSTLVIVDAADMGLPPGSVRIIPGSRAGALGLSTHSMPLSLFMDYIADLCGDVVLVGIQPASMILGQGLSPEAKDAADGLARTIAEDRIAELPHLYQPSLRDDQIR